MVFADVIKLRSQSIRDHLNPIAIYEAGYLDLDTSGQVEMEMTVQMSNVTNQKAARRDSSPEPTEEAWISRHPDFGFLPCRSLQNKFLWC